MEYPIIAGKAAAKKNKIITIQRIIKRKNIAIILIVSYNNLLCHCHHNLIYLIFNLFFTDFFQAQQGRATKVMDHKS